jgi:hypothetical protein
VCCFLPNLTSFPRPWTGKHFVRVCVCM